MKEELAVRLDRLMSEVPVENRRELRALAQEIWQDGVQAGHDGAIDLLEVAIGGWSAALEMDSQLTQEREATISRLETFKTNKAKLAESVYHMGEYENGLEEAAEDALAVALGQKEP